MLGRYLEDGNDVCVGLLDGTIKVVNPAASQASTALLYSAVHSRTVQ